MRFAPEAQNILSSCESVCLGPAGNSSDRINSLIFYETRGGNNNIILYNMWGVYDHSWDDVIELQCAAGPDWEDYMSYSFGLMPGETPVDLGIPLVEFFSGGSAPDAGPSDLDLSLWVSINFDAAPILISKAKRVVTTPDGRTFEVPCFILNGPEAVAAVCGFGQFEPDPNGNIIQPVYRTPTQAAFYRFAEIPLVYFEEDLMLLPESEQYSYFSLSSEEKPLLAVLEQPQGAIANVGFTGFVCPWVILGKPIQQYVEADEEFVIFIQYAGSNVLTAQSADMSFVDQVSANLQSWLAAGTGMQVLLGSAAQANLGGLHPHFEFAADNS